MDTEGESARRVRISQVKGRSKQTEREAFFFRRVFVSPESNAMFGSFCFAKKEERKKWMHLSKQSQK